MEVEIPGISSAWQAPKTCHIEWGTPPGLAPSDDKMVEVWLALHSDKESKTGTAQIYARPVRTNEEQQLYDLLTKSLIERAKYYGSMERP